MAKYAFVPAEALADERLTKTDILVFLALGRFANARTGEAFPSQRKVAALARCTRQTVNRTVKRLAAFGWVEIQARCNERGGRTSSLYRLSFSRTEHTPSVETGAVTPEKTAIREGRKSKDKYLNPAASGATPMASEWRPSSKAVDLAVQDLGISADALADIISEFRDYWRTQGELAGASRSDWDVVFRNHLRQRARFLGHRRPSGQSYRRAKSDHVLERLERQIEAFGRLERDGE